MRAEIKAHLKASIATKQFLLKDDLLLQKIEQLATTLVTCYKNKGKLMLCGNGGSTCDAVHIAEELTGRYNLKRPPLAAIALADAAHITCTGNDFGFEVIFERAVEALGNKGDVLLALSTSGNSINVLKAAKLAKRKSIFVCGMTGLSGGKLKQHCNLWIGVPSSITAHIQEAHITIGHILIHLVEQKLFGNDEG